MRIVCIGGGPAGLYFALLMKKVRPEAEITVVERNHPDDTFGWGVVFSDQTLGNLAHADPVSYEAIRGSFYHWDEIDVHFKGRTITSGGHGFCGIARKRLLNILQERCARLGVELVFQTEVIDESVYADATLIVLSDGVNSAIRSKYADYFQPKIERRRCKYIWLGTHRRFEAFTFAFEETKWGWFQAHAYTFEKNANDCYTSTFIVETPEEVWQQAGLGDMTADESIAFCQQLFARYLDGNPLLNNARHLANPWRNFLRITNERWVHDHLVLLGDAAHTAHFSIGSGTKLALEDAIALVQALQHSDDISAALRQYEAERKVEVIKLQNAARNSTDWFENVKRYTAFETEQFAYSLLTRSQRVSHENLRLRDKEYVASVETWIAQRSGQPARAIPPMFTPFRLRGLILSNRVVVSPMAMYSCQDGTPDDFYLVHMGSHAHGGAAMVFTEMTCVSPDARISPGCAGMYRAEHIENWKRIVSYVHARTPAKIALQLGHAGPKGSTQRGWEEADEPLPEHNWPLIAASAVPYGPHNQTPRPMTRADMDRVLEDFVRAARWGEECGFDWLELHCAHGYLLSSFICPLTNQRNDEYGGSLENRCRYPLEVFRAMRAVWPAHKPMSVRISAHDWALGGNTPDDAVVIAQLFKEAGVDLIDVSSGQTTREARPIYGRMYQTPFADRIRNEVGIATMAVGAIFEPDHVNSIIAAGRADLCALARPHLADPFWTLHAAAQLGYTDMIWPQQYLNGKAQLERNLGKGASITL
ncbi:bifunctional hydroxylase/oxidoreductase [Reticulibacter mediterranei]|uniref:Bifunctional hydroxylase/oxidoreductase n=1 Tax=Reticulibacter mediterranei TaxID=2778369 RepID=A0A8J3IDK9_9CHLR|nr:bifunctional salicylyl-CoA 5-hydroxylase/oxidoreductase [Reticulibacter mediterranei]GHO90613.1 bifunctional hydroxylase/oxidoreductase [Reticulibacter mediterranei]